MEKWIKTFTNQIDKIDEFYQEKFDEYVDEFLRLQGKFMQKRDFEE